MSAPTIETVFGRRKDGHAFMFFYTIEHVQKLYRAFDRLADREDTSFDWDDCYLFTRAVRERLHERSEA